MIQRVSINTKVTELDRIMDPNLPRNRRFAEFFDSALLVRDIMEEESRLIKGMKKAGFSEHGDLYRLALIPRKTWHQMRRVEPNLQKERRLLYKLLARYPVYKPGGIQIIGGQGCSLAPSQDGDAGLIVPASTTASTPPSTPGTSSD